MHYAIARQYTEEEIRLVAERERLLGRTIERIRSSIDLEDILQTTVTEVRQFLKIDRVAIYCCQPFGAETRPPGDRVAVKVDSHSWAPVPKLWGLLMAHHCSGRRSWQEWEIDFLKQLAAQVAIATSKSDFCENVKYCRPRSRPTSQPRSRLIGNCVLWLCRSQRHWRKCQFLISRLSFMFALIT